MASPALKTRLPPPVAPADLGIVFRQVGNVPTILAEIVAARIVDVFIAGRYEGVFARPSPAEGTEISVLTDYFLQHVIKGTERLAQPYPRAVESDRFDYESILLPVTETLRGRLSDRGRAQPLAFDDDD